MPRIGFSSWLIVAKEEVDFSYEMTTSRAVAYLQEGSDTIYFVSIKRALEYAADNDKADVIYVIPGTNPVIADDVVIKNKDTLAFVYEYTLNGTLVRETGEDYKTKNSGAFADLSAATVTARRQNIITLANDKRITIENGAKLIVGGQLGENAQTYISNTTGLYTELQMGENSQIINSGTLDVYGYIKGVNKDNNSIVISESTGKVYLPFVVYDYRGGTYTSNTHNGKTKIFPFNLFDFPNVQTSMKYNYESQLFGRIRIYANKKLQIPNPAPLIGTASSLFLVGDASSSVTFRYNSSTHPYTSNDAKIQTSPNFTLPSAINQTFVTIDGVLSISSMTLSFSGLSLNTKDFYLPFSYKYQFEVTEGSTININSTTKFLKGSSVYLHNGATMNVNSPTIFHQKFYEINAHSTGIRTPSFYNEDSSITSANTIYNAKLINNGTVNINAAFAGRIETDAENDEATVVFNGSYFTVTAPEVSNEGKYRNVTGNAFGNIATDETDEPQFRQFMQGTYTSHETWWIGSQGSTSFEETLGSEASMCLSFDTLILMADDSTKRAGELHAGDLVKIFNHETGQVDIAPIIFNDDVEKNAEDYKVIYLEFNNGSIVKVIYEHGFFNFDTNKYEYIDEFNYREFIGDRFAVISGDKLTSAVLKDAYIKVENTKLCSPVSYFHLNIIAEGMLSMPGGIAGLFNMFEYNGDLSYNATQKAADIEKYGLFTFEDFNGQIPQEVFNALPVPYVKVSLGKGLLTEEDIEILIERYVTNIKSQLDE